MKAYRKEIPGRTKALKVAGGVFLVLFALSLLSAVWLSSEKRTEVKNEIVKKASPPEFDLSPGAYDKAMSLEMKGGGMIFYTLDGSMPSASSTIYTDPINITQQQKAQLMYMPSSPRWQRPIGDFPSAFVIRAAKLLPGDRSSAVTTSTYFVQPKEDPVTLPIISLITEKENLFDYKKGIYIMGKGYEDKDNYVRKKVKLDIPWWIYPANYQDRGKDAERPVHIELFAEGEKGFSVDAGMRIHGNATRGFSQKSLRLQFRKKYGEPSLDYPLFAGNDAESFRSLVLRNSGNDWTETMMRDALVHNLLSKSTKLDASSYRPVVVLINGEYWGIHQLCERLDEDYLENKYKIDKDSLMILQPGGELFHGEVGDEQSFKALLKAVKENDLSDNAAYAQIAKMVDIDNFIDYIIAETWAANTDWPTNNVKCWKYKYGADSLQGARDGRWRWMMHDLDYGMGYTGSAAYNDNLFTRLQKDPNIGLLLRSLARNAEFREKMLSRARMLMANGLSEATVTSRIDQMKKELAPEMPRHIDRWRAISSMTEWEQNIEVIRTFAKHRPAVLLKQLEVFLEAQKEAPRS